MSRPVGAGCDIGAYEFQNAIAPAITTQPSSQTVQDGQSVTFTAGASGYPAPTVQWQVLPAGSATWSNLSGATSSSLTLTAGLAQSGNQYRAVFTNSQGSAISTAATLTVTKRSTTTTLSSSANPSRVGRTVTFTATVTATIGTPTGWVSVSYQNNGTTVVAFAALVNGVARFSTSSLSAGTHSVTATYTGTSLFATSASSPLSQQVS